MDEFIESLKEDRKVRGTKSFLRRVIASWYYQIKIYVSYKMNLALEIIDIVLSALIYYYIGFLVSPEDLIKLQRKFLLILLENLEIFQLSLFRELILVPWLE